MEPKANAGAVDPGTAKAAFEVLDTVLAARPILRMAARLIHELIDAAVVGQVVGKLQR